MGASGSAVAEFGMSDQSARLHPAAVLADRPLVAASVAVSATAGDQKLLANHRQRAGPQRNVMGASCVKHNCSSGSRSKRRLTRVAWAPRRPHPRRGDNNIDRPLRVPAGARAGRMTYSGAALPTHPPTEDWRAGACQKIWWHAACFVQRLPLARGELLSRGSIA